MSFLTRGLARGSTYVGTLFTSMEN